MMSYDQVHSLSASVLRRMSMTGEGFNEAFGYEFRHSSFYENELHQQVRISVKIHLRTLASKKRHQSAPTQKDLFQHSLIPQVQYPD
jgi:hypothetical protein